MATDYGVLRSPLELRRADLFLEVMFKSLLTVAERFWRAQS